MRSAFRKSMFSVRLPLRTSRRSSAPCCWSNSATWLPTKPVAPVTKAFKKSLTHRGHSGTQTKTARKCLPLQVCSGTGEKQVSTQALHDFIESLLRRTHGLLRQTRQRSFRHVQQIDKVRLLRIDIEDAGQHFAFFVRFHKLLYRV